MKYLIIGNPISGKGKLKEILPVIKSIFEKNGINYEIRKTKFKGHAKELASEGLASGFTHIISAGGDGTSSEIANSIYGKDVFFGVIPIGSGNDFPKAANIPLNIPEAVNNLFKGRILECDIAKLGEKCFINGFGIGLDGGVAHRFRYLRKLGPFLGYLAGAVIESFTFKGFDVEAENKDYKYNGSTLLCGASNGSSQGGISLAPDAKIDDGLLDFHFIKNMNFLKRLFTLSKALKSEHVSMQEVDILKFERMELRIFRDIPAHIDGETFVLEKGTHEIEILKSSIKVIVS